MHGQINNLPSKNIAKSDLKSSQANNSIPQAAEEFAAAFQKALKQSEDYTKKVRASEKMKEQIFRKDKEIREKGDSHLPKNQIPIHKTIKAIQTQLQKTYKKDPDLAKELKNLAQDKINTLKKQGYKLKDLDLPKE